MLTATAPVRQLSVSWSGAAIAWAAYHRRVRSDNPFLTDFFEDQEFASLESPHGDFAQKEFLRCRFTRLTLPESDWRGARLDDCTFEHCDLSRIRVPQTALRGVTFVNCRLTGVDWTDVRPTPTVSFEECNLQYSSFVNINLTGTRFAGCRLTDVQFLEARLVESDFSASDLGGARFEGCDLRHANFANARGFVVDPVRNKVKDARIALDAAVLLAESFGLRVNGYDRD